MSDPYATLGLSKNASNDDIKRAYRKLSKEWHPDRHKGEKSAETKFKEINEAYEVLSDEKKRSMYDQFGTVNPGGGFGGGSGGGFGGFSGVDFNNFDFGSFSGGLGDMFEGFFGGRRRQAKREEGQDIQAELQIELKDVLHGLHAPVRLRREASCETCGGKGVKAGSSIVTCTTCDGTGQVVRSSQSFFGQIQQRSVCEVCGGSGSIPKDPCHTCHGEGRVEREESVTVDVPAGIEDGQTLRLRGYGQAGHRGAKGGDLLLRIRVAEDRAFARRGRDTESVATIPVWDALLGAKRTFKTLHGDVEVDVPQGMQSGQKLRIKGKGLPEVGRSALGDHYVTLTVEIPSKLSKQERTLLEEWRQMRG